VDLLQIIKAEHDEIRAIFKSLEWKSLKQSRSNLLELKRVVSIHFALEADHLYPEFEELLVRRPEFLTICSANHRSIVRSLQALIKTAEQDKPSISELTEQTSALASLAETHLALEEDVLMPLVRRELPTAHREELGLVFSDVKSNPDALLNPKRANAVARKPARRA
jgi:hypothetical protein